MRTPVLIALALPMLLAPAARAATAEPCLGEYRIDGNPLTLGAPAGDVDGLGVAVLTAGDADFVVRLGDACTSDLVVQRARADRFVIRARFTGCGETPRFRLRLRFDADCEAVTARVRAHGQTLRDLTARRVEDGPPATGLPTVPTDPNRPPRNPGATPLPPPPPDDSTPIGDRPAIRAFAPLAAEPATEVSLFGSNLDRDENGVPWTGTPPYQVQFHGVDFPAFIRASFTFVSPTELRVIVPTAAVSGTIRLVRPRSGAPAIVLAETAERFVVVHDTAAPVPPPVQGTPPATANQGTLVIQATNESALTPGTFTVRGAQNQIGAFLDVNNNAFVDLAGGRTDVPFLAFPVRTSEFDFAIEQGRGYFTGANAILWVFFEGGDPAVLDQRDVFVAVHLNVDLASRTVRPVALVAGPAGDPGIIVSTDQLTAADVTVEPPVVGGPGAIRGHLSAVASFLQLIFIPSQPSPAGPDFGPEIEQRLIANGFDLTFDVPLFNDR